jgi:hypothetical protein
MFKYNLISQDVVTVVFEEERVNMGTAPVSKLGVIYFDTGERKSSKNLRDQIRNVFLY